MTKILKRYTLPTGEKAKLILDVHWSVIGNQKPYLSSNNIKLLVDGKTVDWNNRDQYLDQIKDIDSDVKTLLDCHLTGQDGTKLHHINNGMYHLNKYRAQLSKPPKTKESFQVEIDELLKGLKLRSDFLSGSAYILPKVTKLLKQSICRVIRNNNYITPGEAFFVCCGDRKSGSGSYTMPLCYEDCYKHNKELIGSLVDNLKLLIKAQNKAISEKDLMTLEQLERCLGCDRETVYQLIATCNSTENLTRVLEPFIDSDALTLKQLTQKYSIETIKN